jgi:IS30 family transposase
LVTYVHSKLAEQWSPELIAARLRVDHPRKAAMRISAECIYQWLFRDALHGGQLYQHLRRRHRRRKARTVGRTRGLIRNRVGIEHRPAGASNRSRYGHWEGDMVEGKRGTGGIATYVERKSRYLVSFKLDGKHSEQLSKGTIRALERLPARLRHTMTLDNGKEFAAFQTTDQALDMTTYFANPHAPWERGTNENTNGLLRQYFPKGIDWSTVSDDELATAVTKLNNRPRKCLAYRSPLEVLGSIGCGAVGS